MISGAAPFLQSVLRIASVLVWLHPSPRWLVLVVSLSRPHMLQPISCWSETTFAPFHTGCAREFSNDHYALGVIDLFILGILGDANISLYHCNYDDPAFLATRRDRCNNPTLLTFAITGSLILTGKSLPERTSRKERLADWLKRKRRFTLFSLL